MRQVNVTIDDDLYDWLTILAAAANTSRPRAIMLILRDARQRQITLTPAGITTPPRPGE